MIGYYLSLCAVLENNSNIYMEEIYLLPVALTFRVEYFLHYLGHLFWPFNHLLFMPTEMPPSRSHFLEFGSTSVTVINLPVGKSLYRLTAAFFVWISWTNVYKTWWANGGHGWLIEELWKYRFWKLFNVQPSLRFNDLFIERQMCPGGLSGMLTTCYNRSCFRRRTEVEVDLIMAKMIHFLRFWSQPLFLQTPNKRAASRGHEFMVFFCVFHFLLDFAWKLGTSAQQAAR